MRETAVAGARVGLFIPRGWSTLRPVTTADLDTILLPEDISNQVSLHCLACKQRLGSVSYVEHGPAQEATPVAVSVSLQADVLKDFRQGPERVILICDCGQKSTFHLL